MIPGVLGAVVGGMIDRQFNGTITPISIGFVISSSVAFAAWRWASSAEQAAAPVPSDAA
jgi:hypothetical protein